MTSSVKDTNILSRGCEGVGVRAASWVSEALERAEVVVGVRVGAKHRWGRKSIRSYRSATVEWGARGGKGFGVAKAKTSR